ncbi:MAG: hypothetical protein GW859_08120 [Sphingomonadales bacterium]|nr:hypothetical protein [Sphingomonadales bacterium]
MGIPSISAIARCALWPVMLACPLGAQAQDVPQVSSAKKDALDISFSLAAKPVFGKNIDAGEESTLRDDAEYSAKIDITYLEPRSHLAFSVVPALSHSPNIFDTDVPETGATIGFKLKRESKFETLVRTGADEAAIIGIPNALKPSIGYSFSWGFENTTLAPAYHDETFEVGLEYDNHAFVYCNDEANSLAAKCTAAVSIAISGGVDHVSSDQPDRRKQFSPYGDVKVELPAHLIRPYGKFSYKHVRFSEVYVVGGGRRRDDKLTGEIGVSFKPLLESWGYPRLNASLAA